MADKYHPDKNKSLDALDRMRRSIETYSVIDYNTKRIEYNYERFQAQSSQPTFIKKGAKMPYKAKIGHNNLTLFVFLLDQSSSMAGPFGGQLSGMSKAQGVANAINRMSSNLAIRC